MSLWQTKSWQEMLLKSHQTEKYFEIDGVFVEKRKVALGEFGLFVIGIEIKDKRQKTKDKRQKTKDLEKKLIELCKKENVLFVQIEDLNYNSTPLSLGGKGWDRENYKKFITPYTAIIDLTKTEQEILVGMKQKGRYNIRLAEKKGIEVKEVEKSRENVKIFYDLMKETTTRDGFSGNTLDYYFEFLNNLKNSKLLFASYEGKVISSGIFVYEDNIAIYYYGASTSNEKFRNLMAPYLLQWNAILIGKKLNCKIYDFLGVATPGDKNSSLAGVTDFKMKFTQDIRKVSESYIFVNKKMKYLVLQLLRRLKGK